MRMHLDTFLTASEPVVCLHVWCVLSSEKKFLFQRGLLSWGSCGDERKKMCPSKRILFCFHLVGKPTCLYPKRGRRNPKIGEENAGYKKMKDIKKTATIPGQNVARERIVLRLCGEIPSRNVGEQRSRSASRARSRDPATRTPQPPPAPVRAPVTPPKNTTGTTNKNTVQGCTSLNQPSANINFQMLHHQSRHRQLLLQHRLLGLQDLLATNQI